MADRSTADEAPDVDDPSAFEQQAGLPVEVTSFVGRRAERAEIRRLFTGSRLVTLTGFGGVGKTRLALKVGGELRRAFRSGVVFVPLASQTDPDLVAHTIAGALGLEGRSTRAATGAVVDYLSTRQLLLVLDNCEHVIDAAALLVDTLLRTCPDLRVLATSREPLRIQGEAVHPVGPLAVPDKGSAEPLQHFESVALFVERSRALVADFEVTDDNAEAVAAIVSKLEGIPLAIELAAGRLRAMTPVELEQNLTERWELLSRGSRTAPQRQRTMAACIEWSFDLCSPTEQELWGRLSVFADGFEMDAARQVCDPLDEPVDDLLLDLVDKSIVIPMTSGGPHTRFRLLPPIRHRGISHLRDQGELTTFRRRHRDWYAGLAERTARDWVGPAQIDNIERLRREMSNLRVALEFCTSSPEEAVPGLRMGSWLHEWGLADGVFRESRVWFDRLLVRHTNNDEVRARALRTASWFAAMQGDLARAAEQLEEGRAIAATVGGHIQVLLDQASAFMAMFAGDVELAARQYDAALAGLESYGDISQQAHTHALASLNHTFRGDLDAALASYEACVALTEPAGESWYRSYAMWIAGLALWAGGRPAEGEEIERESLRLKRGTRDRLGIGTSLEALAWMRADREPVRSARMLGAAQGIWDHIESSTEALPGLYAFHLACHQQLVDALGQEAFGTAFEEGRRLDPIGAIDLALEEKAPEVAKRRVVQRTRTSGTLTPRERQIAELVATGMSNKDIATSLVISKRTAETHVEHILTKLGFNNRNQISAWVSSSHDPA